MQRTIWDSDGDANPAVKESVFEILVTQEIARDRAERSTNPWLVFVGEFFAECRVSNSKPWKNTGTSPMSFASQIYQERQAFQEAFQENGMWDAKEDEAMVSDTIEELCEDDLVFWFDRMDQANRDEAQRQRNALLASGNLLQAA